jgi:DNA-binding NarL/FixJ family response regulator
MTDDLEGPVIPLPTRIEAEIMHLLAHGFASKEIALKMGRSKSTIEQHVRLLCARYHARSRTHLVARAIGVGHVRGPSFAEGAVTGRPA